MAILLLMLFLPFYAAYVRAYSQADIQEVPIKGVIMAWIFGLAQVVLLALLIAI